MQTYGAKVKVRENETELQIPLSSQKDINYFNYALTTLSDFTEFYRTYILSIHNEIYKIQTTG